MKMPAVHGRGRCPRLRLCHVVAALSLSVVFFAPSEANAKVPEVELAAWHTFSGSRDYPDRPELQLAARWMLWRNLGVQPAFRITAPFAIKPRALLQQGEAPIGSVVDTVLSVPLVGAWDFGRFRLQLGLGMAYHFRFVTTHDAARAYDAEPDQPELGRVQALDLTDHPGIDGHVELGFRITDHIMIVAGANYARQVSRLLAQPQGRAFEVSRDTDFSSPSAFAAIRYSVNEPG